MMAAVPDPAIVAHQHLLNFFFIIACIIKWSYTFDSSYANPPNKLCDRHIREGPHRQIAVLLVNGGDIPPIHISPVERCDTLSSEGMPLDDVFDPVLFRGTIKDGDRKSVV